MQILIDIPEEVYKAYQTDPDLSMLNKYQQEMVQNYLIAGLVNGTPLPKGHGKIIDSKEDAADFEKDFDEILDLALKGLKETEDEGEIPADRDYADDNGVKKSDVLKHFGITPKELFKPGNFSSMPPKEDAWRKLSHFHEFEEQADPDKIVCIKFYYDAKFPRAYLSVCGLKVGYPEKT